MPLASGLSSI